MRIVSQLVVISTTPFLTILEKAFITDRILNSVKKPDTLSHREANKIQVANRRRRRRNSHSDAMDPQ